MTDINSAITDGDLAATKHFCLRGNRHNIEIIRNSPLPIIKFLYRSNEYEESDEFDEDDANEAAEYGRLDLVKFIWNSPIFLESRAIPSKPPVLVEIEYPTSRPVRGVRGLRADQSGVNFAVENGHLDVIKFLWNHPIPEEIEPIMSEPPSPRREKGLRITQNILDQAAGNGHLDIIKFFGSQKNKGNQITEKGADKAAANGYLDVVKFLCARGSQVSEKGANKAAANGYLNMVKFLRAKGSQVSEKGAKWAVKYGRLKLFWPMGQNNLEKIWLARFLS